MKVRTFSAIALAGSLLLGPLAWFKARQVDHLEETHQLIVQQNAELRRTLQQTTSHAAVAQEPSRIEPPAPAISGSNIAARAKRPVNLIEQLAEDPRLQNLKIAARRGQLAISFEPLYRTLALTPEQIRRFEDNLLRHEQERDDLSSAARARGVAPNDPTVQKLLGDSIRAYRATQRELLGDYGMTQLEEHERLESVREVTSGLAAAAAMAGVPFNAEQAERVAQLLANASATYENSHRPNMGRVDWDRVRDEGRTFLSESQLTIITTTEPPGPRGMGGRFAPALSRAIEEAVKQDALGSRELVPKS